MNELLKTVNLTKVYRTDEVETTALDNINLTIQEGEFVSIMGPSGCGKSTLLNVIGLLDSANSGELHFQAQNILQIPEKKKAQLRKEKIGFVFQNFNLIDELSVFENVELPLTYLNIPKKERKDRVEDILQKMDIYYRKDHYPLQLSGGLQQRVAVARAVVPNPALVLADEPTGNLDSKNGADVMNILTDLNEQGTTIVMVTHSVHDAAYSNRTIQLLDGKVVTTHTATPFSTSSQH